MYESDPITAFLAEVDEEHKLLTGLISSLSLDEVLARPDGQWSAVDLLVHITAWQENALRLAREQASIDSKPLDPDVSVGQALGLDTKDFNEELLVTHRDWLLDQALTWNNHVLSSLLTALVSLPPKRFLGGTGPHGVRRCYATPALVHSRLHRQEFEQRLGR